MENMPFQISKLYRERKVLNADLKPDNPPKLMEEPEKEDYPSDEDSDDEIEFELEIHPLENLINDFEKDDEVLHQIEKTKDDRKDEAKVKGLKFDDRLEILDLEESKKEILDKNIEITKKKWQASLPTKLQELNSKIKDRTHITPL